MDFEKLPSLHKTRLKIKKRKYNDLQDLKAIVPSDYHRFYDDLPFIDKAIAKLRTLCAAEQSSEESEEDLSSSETDQSFDFWQTHKELAHGKRKKKQGYSGDSSEITICRSFQPGRAGQSGLRVNEEANQLEVDSEADLINVDEQAYQA
ncbi:hypothetical protein J6590_069594 [Homalodisca vitripennis]|nr:hypothetical protein J6590_069594 [Homalodisca vitripennis]